MTDDGGSDRTKTAKTATTTGAMSATKITSIVHVRLRGRGQSLGAEVDRPIGEIKGAPHLRTSPGMETVQPEMADKVNYETHVPARNPWPRPR